MMKAAKLFIDGSEYKDNVLLDCSCLEASVGTYLYNFVDLSEYNDNDSCEISVIDKSGKELIRGTGVVNIFKTVTLKVNND